jgi:hypothetical protein
MPSTRITFSGGAPGVTGVAGAAAAGGIELFSIMFQKKPPFA